MKHLDLWKQSNVIFFEWVAVFELKNSQKTYGIMLKPFKPYSFKHNEHNLQEK